MSTTAVSINNTIRLRAGIADFNEETKLCTPLPVQGEITIKPNEEEEELGFYDFEWKPIEKPSDPAIEAINLILVPGETLCIQIDSCKSGRVFSLVFSSNQTYFFWLQEKNPLGLKINEFSEKDKANLDKIRAILNSNDEDEDEEDDDDEEEDDDDAIVDEKADVEMN
ncbi:hypothetical protein Kpol_1052p34 [Vanderwaltozyma polyspora DSM 70294]|uniref:Pru domain-containing protein n=1 Tax=Vanderwaltozyma polyspora (strain ATCC 22028 / DSM 70294 / BCRC 21397 / CBS 2163 / NBRC 10782 / NRRL Y-8283 / UCD 57-17) TaxID=436907 RepID=A7TM44_VANPO|nr:uncharacterized protein Kpol_1052p34 [Vanderwaltozyma polyspora DSM 70294]EDO16686.1 hypothetical protein Kpol_1052p34 [Vanderwaltozyma polyspora DSM 70294]